MGETHRQTLQSALDTLDEWVKGDRGMLESDLENAKRQGEPWRQYDARMHILMMQDIQYLTLIVQGLLTMTGQGGTPTSELEQIRKSILIEFEKRKVAFKWFEEFEKHRPKIEGDD